MSGLWALIRAGGLGRSTVAAFAWLTTGSLARAATTVLAFPLVVGLAARAGSTWWYLLTLLAALAVGAYLDLRASVAAFDVGLGVATHHDEVLLARVRRAPLAWFGLERRRRLEQMFATGGVELAQGLAHLLAPLFDAFLTTTFVALGVLLVAPGLGALLLALVLLQLLAFTVQVALARASETEWFEAAERFSASLAEFSRLQPLLRLTPGGASARVLTAASRQHAATVRLATVSIVGHQAVTVARTVAVALIPLQIVWSLSRGAVTGVEAAALLVVAARFLDPFMQLDRLGATLTGALAILRRLSAVLGTHEAPTDGAAAADEREPAQQPPTESAAPALSVSGLSFGYPGRRSRVVDDVSFEVENGQTLAIVGPSGSGKSTILALLAGLETPDSGTISYAGVPHTELGPAGVAARTSAVFQTVSLVGDTILENVQAGDPGASLAQCEQAAAAAQLDELIARLPRGWLTAVGEDGGQLSGGERQRVTLARALLKPAPLLLLDEATSSLDALTESGFVTALEARRGVQTSVIVAHRLHTIASADKILFVEGGAVKESGTLAELLALEGRFAAYWEQRQQAASWSLSA